MNISLLQWQCSCGGTAPATSNACFGLLARKDHRGHKINLVDKETGKVIARSPKGAEKLGISLTGATQERREPIREPIGESRGEDDDVRTIRVPASGLITMRVTLPADALAYHNMARAIGVEPTDRDFDDWLWDCIKARFEKDYRLQVMIAGVPD